MAIRARWALAGAAACGALLVVTWFAAFHIAVFERADRSILIGFFNLTYGHSSHRVEVTTNFFVGMCNLVPYVALVCIPVAVALARGRRRVAIAIAVMLAGANITAELFKHILPEPRGGFIGFAPLPTSSWPSGHATAAMALALAFALAAPARLRPLVAVVGAMFATAVGYSVLARDSHYPSDVLGGFLVAAVWTLLTVAVLRSSGNRYSATATTSERFLPGEALRPLGIAALLALAFAGIFAVSNLHGAVDYARGHHAFVFGALVIVATSVALSTAVALVVQASDTGLAPTAAHRRRWRPG